MSDRKTDLLVDVEIEPHLQVVENSSNKDVAKTIKTRQNQQQNEDSFVDGKSYRFVNPFRNLCKYGFIVSKLFWLSCQFYFLSVLFSNFSHNLQFSTLTSYFFKEF